MSPPGPTPPSPRDERQPLRQDEVASLFHGRGVPYTIQRRTVFEVLQGRSDHPTAETVHAEVTDRLPGLSKATVYRSLETLVELGLAVRIGHPGSSARYDPKTWRHHHLICDACGVVSDLEDDALDRLPVATAGREGFQVRDYSVQFSGLCATCSSQG